MLTSTEVYDQAALAALIASANLLGTNLKAGLFTNDISPSKVLVIGDLTEPDYEDYARQALVMGTAFRDPLRGIASVAAPLTWKETGDVTPVIIKGIFYVYGAGPALLGVEVFNQPIPLNDGTDAFQTVLEYVQSAPSASFTLVIQ